MAVKSTVGESIESMLRLAASNPSLPDQTARRQQNEVNARALEGSRYQDWVGDVDTAGNYITYDTTGDGSIAKVDVDRLNRERPDLVLKALNMDPRYNVATDENGVKIATEVSDIIQNEDGSFSALVTRPDGRKAPLTENRTAQGDDIVVKLSPDDFRSVVSNRYLAGITRGGKENAGSFMRDMGQMNRIAIQEAALNEGASRLEQDPAAMSKFYTIVNTADDQTLNTIAADMGIDVSALTEDKRTALQIKARDEATAAANVRNVKLGQLASTDIRKGIVDINKKIASNQEKLATPAGKAAEKRISELEKEREALIQQALNEDKSLTGLRNERSSLAAAGTGRKNLTKEGGERLQDLENNLIPAREAEIRNALTTGTTENLLSAKVEVPTIDGSQVSLTAGELREAIRKGTVTATPDQVQKMRQYLVDNGVESPEDLQRLPPKDQMMAALVASVGMGKTNEERAKAFQENLNFLQRGARDRTLTQEITSQQDERDSRLAAQTLSVRRQELARNLRKDQNDLIAQFGEAGKEAAELSAAVIENIINADGDFTSPSNFTAAQVKMNQLVNTAASFSPQDPRYAAYQRASLNALVPYMVALAEKEGTGSALNPLNWARKLTDLIKEDATFTVGNMSERIQVVSETRNGKKIPASIRILDNTGAPTEINIPIQDLNLSSGLLNVLANIPQAQGR